MESTLAALPHPNSIFGLVVYTAIGMLIALMSSKVFEKAPTQAVNQDKKND